MRILLVRVAADTRYMRAMYQVVRMEPLSLEYLGAAIKADHEDPTELHLFPAVPAPIAVCIGRDLLPKVDPALVIYDANKKNAGGFARTLEVNSP